MFIIWGSKHTSKVIATVNKNFNCTHCHNIVSYQIVKETDWFELYFIPLIPLVSVYRAECPICSFGFEVDKKRVKEILTDLKAEKGKKQEDIKAAKHEDSD